ncbi:MAG: hypothetical protein ACRD25_08260 [Terracidiphilus sp.]
MHSQQAIRPQGGRFFGFPLEGFGFFTSMLLAFAAAFFTFFASTFLAIMWLLVWNGILGHTVNYADSYLYVGLPAGLGMLILALPVFVTLWMRAKLKKLRD